MTRTGRRPGTSDTRDQILAVARRRFATSGYDAASLRGIASDAKVDPALLIHYFGTKEGLFTAATGLPTDPTKANQTITSTVTTSNATATKTWRVIVYSAQHPDGQVVAQRTFTLGQGWYWFSFGVHQVFSGLTAVCITASDSFGVPCLHFAT